MKTAKNIMTANPKVLGSGEELRATIRIFLESGVHYVPVVTPMGEILGFFSEFGLVRAALKHFLDKDNREKIINHKELLEEALYVFEDSSLEDVVRAMMKSPTRRVLVKTNLGKVSGIISPKDLLRALEGEVGKEYDLSFQLDKARQEAKELSQRVKDLQSTITKYQSFIDDSPYMIHSVDQQGKIIMANKKLHQVLGYEPGELIGKGLKDLYADSVVHEALAGLQKIKDTGSHSTTYSTMMSKEGEKIRVDVASSALVDHEGRFLSTITISREIDSEALLRALHGVLEAGKN